jgi:hypothetical protein
LVNMSEVSLAVLPVMLLAEVPTSCCCC